METLIIVEFIIAELIIDTLIMVKLIMTEFIIVKLIEFEILKDHGEGNLNGGGRRHPNGPLTEAFEDHIHEADGDKAIPHELHNYEYFEIGLDGPPPVTDRIHDGMASTDLCRSGSKDGKHPTHTYLIGPGTPEDEHVN